jgi:hypothetical protein
MSSQIANEYLVDRRPKYSPFKSDPLTLAKGFVENAGHRRHYYFEDIRIINRRYRFLA